MLSNARVKRKRILSVRARFRSVIQQQQQQHETYQLACLLCCVTLILLIVIQSSLALPTSTTTILSNHQDVDENNNRLALTPNDQLNLKFSLHSRRSKRQASTSSTTSNSNGGSQPAAASSTSGADSSAGGSIEGSGDEGGAQEVVVLNSLKCDFGSSDAPDLCKFRILQNGPIKALNSWIHGSGKLALYQGGPLFDAGDKNDTSGGYIFYETSNPYAGSSNNQSSSLTTSSSSSSSSSALQKALSHQLYDSTRPQQQNNHRSELGMSQQSPSAPPPPHMHTTATDYYSTPSSHHWSINPHHNTHGEFSAAGDNSAFQHVSSGRISIDTSGAGVGAMNTQLVLAPSFVSPNLTAPGPSGMCLSFQYLIQGLSAEELRIYVNDHKSERSRLIWFSTESSASNWTRGEVLYSATGVHSLMFSAGTQAGSGSTKDVQQRKFRGHIALDEIDINKHDPNVATEGACKGHCNFDGDLCGWTNGENKQEDDFDWSLGRGSENLFTGPSRDFTSSANNEMTGSYLQIDSGYPRRPGDRAILLSPMFQPTAMNDAMCMRFAVHMFGSGIGSLVIKIRYADETINAPPAGGGATTATEGGAGAASSALRPDGKPNNDLIIWEMSGDAGNSWHQAQTSVSSSKSQFQVVIEGVIGENHLGNIAVDEISFSSGPCPTSPPVASKNYGDCTFEQSMCYWRNPDADMHLDDLDWIRSADEQSIHGPNFDHTLKKRSGSYLKLENTFREPKSGSRAFLLSPIFQPKAQAGVQCLSFYYYMFMRSISSSGPNLGTIRVYLASNNELVPIWRLTNPISSPNWKHARASLSTALIDGQPTAPTKLFQIAFEGIWGDAPGGAIALDDITVFDGACEIMPAEAKSVPGECTFDVDMCSWSNKTSELTSALTDSTDGHRSPFIQSVNSASGNSAAKLLMASKRIGWQLATVDSRPVNLQDHTYRAPIGYVYVDVLDASSSRMTFPLQSAEVTVQTGVQVMQCLSFWYAAYGRQDNNLLNVYLTQASVPPPQADDSSGSAGAPGSATTANRAPGAAPPVANSNPSSSASNSPGSSGSAAPASAGSEADGDNPTAWKNFNGKLVWSIGLRNITETNRRKWQYGQVSLNADSNFIVRFIAQSSDGGFALDDISYYEGLCETRPMTARVQSEDDAIAGAPPATNPKP